MGSALSLNTALVEGDAISTDHNARVELQIDARNFVRPRRRTRWSVW
jgi:hypothetical protein